MLDFVNKCKNYITVHTHSICHLNTGFARVHLILLKKKHTWPLISIVPVKFNSDSSMFCIGWKIVLVGKIVLDGEMVI